MEPKIAVHFLWSDEELRVDDESAVVLVDTLRASTTICAALDAGAKKVMVVREADDARIIKAEDDNALLAGERSAKKLEGFDVNNSPVKMLELAPGKDVVLTTSNFCRVIDHVASKGAPVISACLVNANATADYLIKKGYANVYFVATGTYHIHGKSHDEPFRTEEDMLTAVYIAYLMSQKANVGGLDDRQVARVKDIDEFEETLHNLPYSKHLFELGESEDLEACITINKHPVVTILKKDKCPAHFMKVESE